MENKSDNNTESSEHDTNDAGSRSTNLAIGIVVAAGIILGAILLANRPASDIPPAAPPTPTVQVQPTVPGQTTTVPTPAQYTIAFNADGTVNGLADCNSFGGSYSQVGGLNIRITSMTRAACPEGSLDQQYLQLLESVAGGGPDGSGNLALETAGGAQRMLFQNGGPAQ